MMGLRWIFVLMLVVGGGRAAAQDLPVAGDDGHLWVLRPADGAGEDAEGPVPGAGGTVVLHRGPGDEPDRLEVVDTLRGLIRPGGVAVGGSELWLVYSDGTLQSIHAAYEPQQRLWRFEGNIYQRLPIGAELRGFAVGAAGPWAILRMTAAEVEAAWPTERGEAPAADAADRTALNIALGLPPNFELTPAPESAPEAPADVEGTPVERAEPDVEPAAAVAEWKERDYLCQLAGSRWRATPLPEDWGTPAASWLVMPDAEAARPVLVALVGDPGEELVTYTWDEGAWRREAYPRGAGPFTPLAVAGQLVVAEEVGASPLRVAVRALRLEQAVEVGTLTIETGADAAWGATPAGLAVAVVVHDASPPPEAPETPEAPASSETSGVAERGGGLLSGLAPPALPPLGLWWARLDLSGEVVQPATPLERAVRHPWANTADYAVMLAIAMLAMLMLVVFWRRDPASNLLLLPDDLVLAELPRRALAGAIDFAPAALVAMEVFNLGFMELLQRHWPGTVSSFEALAPGAVAIGLFVTHTMVGELIGGRSIGKMATGLRVVGMRGQRPRAWQVVARNVLKAFDLMAPLLLVLPAIGPLRQRLGDLMARTVVVVPRGDEEGRPDDDAGDAEKPGDPDKRDPEA